jgi:rod shape-determining protein MreD
VRAAARVILGLAAALAVQTTLSGLVLHGTAALDLVLIVVVYVALTSGPITGLLAGTVAGLAQDALSSGVLGIGGLAKTLVGFGAGVLGTQFIITAPLPRFVVFVLASIAHAAIFIGLYVVLDLRVFPSPYAAVLGQALGNGFVGVVMAQLIELLPGVAARRRASRSFRRQ